MEKTGESYAAARRHIVAGPGASTPVAESPKGGALVHFPGTSPAPTALRILLAHAGVLAPHTKQPFTEAMTFGIGGGVGAGVFAFHYEKDGWSSLFVSGRHLWCDDVAWMKAASQRFGMKPIIAESGGATAAAKALVTATANGPAVAWVDKASLPYWGLPASWVGGGYHVLTVYQVDGDHALVGDLADEPIRVPLSQLNAARARIKKDKSRLLTLSPATNPVDLRTAVKAGLSACAEGLVQGRMTSFTLEAFRLWGERMYGARGKDSWDVVFPPGPKLWRGLWSIHDFIEHWGSGGGLSRPLMADFLAEAADALSAPGLRAVGERYAALGRGWTALAEAALPENVPDLFKARGLLARKAEVFHGEGEPTGEELRSLWDRLSCLGKGPEAFPLSDEEAVNLRKKLKPMILDLYAGEKVAQEALARAAEL